MERQHGRGIWTRLFYQALEPEAADESAQEAGQGQLPRGVTEYGGGAWAAFGAEAGDHADAEKHETEGDD